MSMLERAALAAKPWRGTKDAMRTSEVKWAVYLAGHHDLLEAQAPGKAIAGNMGKQGHELSLALHAREDDEQAGGQGR